MTARAISAHHASVTIPNVMIIAVAQARPSGPEAVHQHEQVSANLLPSQAPDPSRPKNPHHADRIFRAIPDDFALECRIHSSLLFGSAFRDSSQKRSMQSSSSKHVGP